MMILLKILTNLLFIPNRHSAMMRTSPLMMLTITIRAIFALCSWSTLTKSTANCNGCYAVRIIPKIFFIEIILNFNAQK